MSLRRGRGVSWCEAGAHYVTESQIQVREGNHWVRLKNCKDCQVGRTGNRYRSAQADLARRL